MKIVIVTPSFAPSLNGLANVVTRQALWLRAQGCEVEVLVPGDHDYDHCGVPVQGISLYGSFSLRSPPRGDVLGAIRRMKSLRCDVVICHAAQVALVDLALLYAAPVRVYYSHGVSWASRIRRGSFAGWARLASYLPYRVLGPAIIRRQQNAVFLGAEAKNDRTLDMQLFRGRNKLILPNASDLKPAAPRQLSENQRLKLLVVGAFSKEKGFDRLEALLPKLDERSIQSVTICSFSTDGLSDFKDRVQRGEIRTEVHFVTDKSGSDLFPYYLDSDVFLNLSHSECYPLVVADAVNARLPIISFDVGYQREIKGSKIVHSVAEVADFLNKWPSNLKEVNQLSSETSPLTWEAVFRDFYHYLLRVT